MLMVNQLVGFGVSGGIGGNDAFTKLLLHADGVDGATTFPDASLSARAVTANGNAQVDTAQSKFGGSGVLFANPFVDTLTCAASADFAFSGDFTVDFWTRFSSALAGGSLINSGSGWGFYYDGSRLGFAKLGTGFEASAVWSPSNNTWYHLAAARSGSALKVFVDGAVHASGTTSTSYSQTGLNIGDTVSGWMDEIRISKGVARWTAAFTPPAEPYG